MDISALPGNELIGKGLRDLDSGIVSNESLLVMIGAARLRAIGLNVGEKLTDHPERNLYERLVESDGDGAHSSYNALIRRLVSFERAAECASR